MARNLRADSLFTSRREAGPPFTLCYGPGPMTSLAAFVSPHGYGHAARCCAILAELERRRPELQLHVYTLVPEWFFRASLGPGLTYHELRTDVGLVQRSPVEEDLSATVEALDRLLPFRDEQLDPLAAQLRRDGCRLAICDIAPLGIAVARWAGIPSVLVENFTWDWIYRGYPERPERLEEHAAYLAGLFAAADHHLQTSPVCEPTDADLVTRPVSRRLRQSRDQTRGRLGLAPSAPVALLTMGGIPGSYSFLDRLREHPELHFVVPGAAEEGQHNEGRLVRIPHHSRYFHPDLVNAADVVVGKLGYSTVAEAFHGGKAVAWVGRPDFRESPVLARFVGETLPSAELSPEDFASGDWVHSAERLARERSPFPTGPNGSEQAADYLEPRLSS